jgi:hypothetical protein
VYQLDSIFTGEMIEFRLIFSIDISTAKNRQTRLKIKYYGKFNSKFETCLLEEEVAIKARCQKGN